ncbi:MAG: Gfo/Idh/MocA family protein [Bryobacteraceae bacterium]
MPVKPQVAVIGGGMITHDQILPSLYQLQRLGQIGEITVCASRPRTVQALAQAEGIRRAFPGHSFRAAPEPGDSGESQPGLFREVIARMRARQIVVAAVPDQLHYDVIMTALTHNQHVCAVKPLVLQYGQAVEIEREARSRDLCIGVEYHKRFDDRSHMARRRYRAGLFGDFRLGTACLLEKWYYRRSNFQNWCTAENSDAFSYIGCHYVDLVHFITGLLPVRVSVYGIRDRYPNGNEGFLWTDARVIWNNEACLNVQNALGFPDEAPGANTQGLTMYCRGASNGAWLAHSDQYRGLQYCYTERAGDPGSTIYAEPSADYFQYVDLGGQGLTPVGYGYRSIAYIVGKCIEVESAAPVQRRELLKRLDDEGIMATPANSSYNELVLEAGRASILNGGRAVDISYGDAPGIRPT